LLLGKIGSPQGFWSPAWPNLPSPASPAPSRPALQQSHLRALHLPLGPLLGPSWVTSCLSSALSYKGCP
jgi:hypothetical protein